MRPNLSGYCPFHKWGMSVRWFLHWSVQRKDFDRILHSLKFLFLFLNKKWEVKLSDIPTCQYRGCYIEYIYYQHRINSSTSGHNIFSFRAGPVPFFFLLAVHLCSSVFSEYTTAKNFLLLTPPELCHNLSFCPI